MQMMMKVERCHALTCVMNRIERTIYPLGPTIVTLMYAHSVFLSNEKVLGYTISVHLLKTCKRAVVNVYPARAQVHIRNYITLTAWRVAVRSSIHFFSSFIYLFCSARSAGTLIASDAFVNRMHLNQSVCLCACAWVFHHILLDNTI